MSIMTMALLVVNVIEASAENYVIKVSIPSPICNKYFIGVYDKLFDWLLKDRYS